MDKVIVYYCKDEDSDEFFEIFDSMEEAEIFVNELPYGYTSTMVTVKIQS